MPHHYTKLLINPAVRMVGLARLNDIAVSSLICRNYLSPPLHPHGHFVSLHAGPGFSPKSNSRGADLILPFVWLRSPLQIKFGARTNVGCVRKNNEDSYKTDADLQLYVLSDGMGGEASGEVASGLAVETVIDHCRKAAENPSLELVGERKAELSDATNRLVSALRLANQRIFETAAGNSDQKGMGATIVTVWLNERRVSLAHVGDSRAYLLRAGSFDQLTADHSLVADLVRNGIMTPQQAEVSEQQSILTRALGTKQKVEVDADEQLLLEGDTILLCSDGLTRMVTDPEIASTLETHLDPQKAANRLVELANENGGQDNVTVIVVHLAPEARGLWATLRRWLGGSPSASSASGGS